MTGTRKRVGIALGVALLATALSLSAAVAASARDGHGADDGVRAGEVRGHEAEHEQEAARREDRRVADDDQGKGRGRTLLHATLAPSVPDDPPIEGVAAGGLPWVLDSGSVRLRADGRFHLAVKGLVIPVEHTVGGTTFPAGTARPVTTVSASLRCGSAVAATTDAVPISETGDAAIDATITVPAKCLAPVVLVHPNGSAGAYIAASSFHS